MLLLLSTALLTFFAIVVNSAQFPNCQSFPGNPLEVQCPKNEPKVILFFGETTTRINCKINDTFPMDVLPNFPKRNRQRLELFSCASLESFKTISDHFQMDLKVLQIEDVKTKITLTKKSFFGLSLEKLTLNHLHFEGIEDDAFSELSNLIRLEMESNQNLTLKVQLFQNLTKLESLYMNTNDLEELPDGLFLGLPNLQRLHLLNNKLTVLTNKTFEGLVNLKSLELHTNKIHSIAPGAFSVLPQLQALSLSKNQLATIPSDLFSTNANLRQIHMSINPEIQLPNFLFSGLNSLEIVELSKCNLTVVPEDLFSNSSKLTNIDLQKNKIEEVPLKLFQSLNNLQRLSLQNNRIFRIQTGLLDSLSKLKELNLANNRIKEIDNHVFEKTDSLEVVDLSQNELSFVNFDDLQKLVKVYLSGNRIKRVPYLNHPVLKTLDLGYNIIQELLLSNLQPHTNLEVILNNNTITRINLNNINELSGPGKTTISLSGNPLNCTCELYEFYKILHEPTTSLFSFKTDELACATPSNLKNIQINNLEAADLTCDLSEPDGCPHGCFCRCRQFDTTVVMDCNERGFKEFPEISGINCTFGYTQIEMYLERNHLEVGPERNNGYERVTKLYLGDNYITEVEWLPPKLEVLELDNNQLTFLNSDLLSSSLVNLSLDSNPWRCDCSALNLTNFLREHPQMISQNIYCHHNKKLLVNLTEADLCLNNLIFYILLPVLLLSALSMVPLVLFYRYQQPIKVWLFSKNLCLCWVTEKDLDKDKIYDAFISYSNKDEDFVTQNLIPVLEGSPNSYKLCLHYRDFIPGENILSQVTQSVLDSRKTLVVLSPNFLESVWGKAEFRTAHTHAMTEGRSRVIIVLYGDIDIDKVDDELKSYLKTNTYVKWGDRYFWRKLKYALQHSKKARANMQKVANMISCIDDKFNLVAPITTAPNSTPPVLNLDSEALKKDPLSFVENGISVAHTGPDIV